MTEPIPVECGNCGGVFHADEVECPGCGWPLEGEALAQGGVSLEKGEEGDD